MNIVLYPYEQDKFFLRQLSKDIENTNTKIYYTYKKQNFSIYTRVFRKILRELFGWNEEKLYGEWKKEKNKTIENVIIFDSALTPKLLEYLKENYNNSKLIFWYRNPIVSLEQLEKVKRYSNIVLTFDKEEAEKYDLNYIEQFYYNPNNLNLKDEFKTIKNDVYFIGADKNRINKLEEISEYLKEKGIKQKIQILKDKKKKYKKYEKIELIEKSLSYSEILENIFLSKCILEICQKGQKGLTFRTMEALFFNKKLISNNKNLKKYEFYNKNNIFILNEEKRTIEEFFNEPFVEIDEKIKEKYLFENWLEKIVKKEDF